jgi:hypothetical protein
MKVIDLLVDKVNGKQLPNKIKANGIMFILDKDINEYKREDGDAEEFHTDYMIDGFVDLTDEVEIIEEDKKIEMLIIGKDDVAWCEGNMKTDEEMVDIVLDIKDKINEIIMVINEMRKDK